MSVPTTISDIVDHVESEIADGTITFAKGRKALHEHAVSPRIVAIPTSGNVGEDVEPGRRDISAGLSTREIYVRRLTVEWHCWGSDDAEAESLMLKVMRALRNGDTMGSVEMVDERWPLQEEGQQGHTFAGTACVLSVRHAIPVVDVDVPRTGPVNGDHAGTMTFHNGNEEAGCAA